MPRVKEKPAFADCRCANCGHDKGEHYAGEDYCHLCPPKHRCQQFIRRSELEEIDRRHRAMHLVKLSKGVWVDPREVVALAGLSMMAIGSDAEPPMVAVFLRNGGKDLRFLGDVDETIEIIRKALEE